MSSDIGVLGYRSSTGLNRTREVDLFAGHAWHNPVWVGRIGRKFVAVCDHGIHGSCRSEERGPHGIWASESTSTTLRVNTAGTMRCGVLVRLFIKGFEMIEAVLEFSFCASLVDAQRQIEPQH